MKLPVLFFLILASSISFARTNYISAGLVYQNEKGVYTDGKAGIFNSLIGTEPTTSESNFEAVGFGLGFTNLSFGEVGLNGFIDITQLSQGIAQQTDFYTNLEGSYNINYSFTDWFYPFVGLNGGMRYFKTRPDTWYQYFGGVGWQYGLGLHFQNLFLEISRRETTDQLMNILKTRGTTYKGYVARVYYGWDF